MKVLILAPSLKIVGGIQRYVLTLTKALEDLFGKECVRLLSLDLPGNVEGLVPRTVAGGAKLRFVTTALCEAAAWRPDLVICAHVGEQPNGSRFPGGRPLSQ